MMENKIKSIEKRLNALHALVIEFWVEDIKSLQRHVKILQRRIGELETEDKKLEAESHKERLMEMTSETQSEIENFMKKVKKINNFVKKYMDRLHKPVTHVDKKKRDKINKCREKIKVEDVT